MIGLETIVAVLLSFVTAGTVVRLGRCLPAQGLRFAYLLAAYSASLLGLAADWTVNRWRRLPADEQTWDNVAVGLAEAWQIMSRPEFAEQWIPLALTVSVGLGLMVAAFPGVFRSLLGGAVCWVVAVLLTSGLMYQILASSVYFLPPETFWAKTGYVLVPAAALSLGWLGQWLAIRRLRVTETSGPASAPTSSAESGREAESGQPSRVYLLALLAVSLSTTLLLATSGTLSLATKSLVFAVIPLAWILEAGLPILGTKRVLPVAADRTLAGWLPVTAGLMVVLGYFFAEVPLGLAGLWAISLLWLPWLWPSTTASALNRWGWALWASAPALIAAGVSAGMMVAQNG